jgi:hypothetical protein
MIMSVIFHCYSELSHFTKVFNHFPPLEIMSTIFHCSVIFCRLRSCQPFFTAQPICKMVECGARVVTQSRAHEREAAGGSIVAARGAQGQVAWAGRARGGGGDHTRGAARDAPDSIDLSVAWAQMMDQ